MMANAPDNVEAIEAKLAAYIDGELTDAERAEIEAHLLANPSHQVLMDELRRHSRLLRGLPRAVAPPDITESLQTQLERAALLGGTSDEPAVIGRIGFWPQWLSAAAVVLLTAGLAFVVYTVLPERQPNLATIQAPRQPSPAVDPMVDVLTQADAMTRENARLRRGAADVQADGDTPRNDGLTDRAADGRDSNRFLSLLAGDDAETVVLTVQASDTAATGLILLNYLAQNQVTFAHAEGRADQLLGRLEFAEMANKRLDEKAKDGGLEQSALAVVPLPAPAAPVPPKPAPAATLNDRPQTAAARAQDPAPAATREKQEEKKVLAEGMAKQEQVLAARRGDGAKPDNLAMQGGRGGGFGNPAPGAAEAPPPASKIILARNLTDNQLAHLRELAAGPAAQRGVLAERRVRSTPVDSLRAFGAVEALRRPAGAVPAEPWTEKSSLPVLDPKDLRSFQAIQGLTPIERELDAWMRPRARFAEEVEEIPASVPAARRNLLIILNAPAAPIAPATSPSPGAP